jgi:hypothetical protein
VSIFTHAVSETQPQSANSTPVPPGVASSWVPLSWAQVVRLRTCTLPAQYAKQFGSSRTPGTIASASFFHQVFLGGIRFLCIGSASTCVVQCRVVGNLRRRVGLTAFALAVAVSQVTPIVRAAALVAGLCGCYRSLSHGRSVWATRSYERPYRPGDVLVYDLVKDPSGPRGQASALIVAVGVQRRHRILAFVNAANASAVHFWIDTMGATVVAARKHATGSCLLVECTASRIRREWATVGAPCSRPPAGGNLGA